MTGNPQTRDQFPYPHGSVVGGIPDDGASDDARARLEQAGFGPDRYQVLHGERDVERIDVTGEAHGWTGTIMRRLQDAVSDEAEHVRRYAQYLRDGHYLFAVSVGKDAAAKQDAAAALGAAHADFLTYYAGNYIEDLGTSG